MVKIANYFKNELKDYYLVRRHAALHKDFVKKIVEGNTIKQFSRRQTQVKVHKNPSFANTVINSIKL